MPWPDYLVARTCTGEDSPFHPFPPVDPRRVNSLPLRVGSRDSRVGVGGVVAVPEPAVSDSGRVPGRPSGRWGDFPHARGTGVGLPLSDRGLSTVVNKTFGRRCQAVRSVARDHGAAAPEAAPVSLQSRSPARPDRWQNILPDNGRQHGFRGSFAAGEAVRIGSQMGAFVREAFKSSAT